MAAGNVPIQVSYRKRGWVFDSDRQALSIFHYCEGCADGVNIFQKYRKGAGVRIGATACMVVTGLFFFLFASQAFKGNAREPAHPLGGAIAIGIGALLCIAAIMLPLRSRAKYRRRAVVREGQAVFGPAAFFVGWRGVGKNWIQRVAGSQQVSVYIAARREWLDELERVNQAVESK